MNDMVSGVKLRRSASIDICTSRERLYDLVSDVRNMGQWSPTCCDCWYDDDAGPHVGAHFTGRNETPERTWETRSTVMVAEPGAEFAWHVGDHWVSWSYDFEQVGDKTKLRETWRFLPNGILGFQERYGAAALTEIAKRSMTAERDMPLTLAAIKRTAET